jgi:cation diffusion facilitator CzcD-associated flavoprotein CzcO
MSVRARSVAVIGAGPSGAIATDALVKEQAFDRIRVFERRPVPGGAWIYTPHLPAGIPSLKDVLNGEADPVIQIPAALPAETPKSAALNSHQIRFSDTPQHENLHSNIIPEIMSFTRYPFPKKASAPLQQKYEPDSPYHSREAIRIWIEEIFYRNGNDKLLELNTTVELAEKKGEKWLLTLRQERANSNYWWQESFDGLVVASGHYNIPWVPEIPGLLEYNARFPGRIVHSKHFREGAAFRNKRVVVVGASVSSSEIVHEVLPFAKHPVIASLRGAPIPAFGLIPWEHPHVVVKKQISQFDHQTGKIFFNDGTVVEDVDHVILGTGYTFSLPYLPKLQENIKKGYRRLPGVYQHTWNIEDSSLTFIGMVCPHLLFLCATKN